MNEEHEACDAEDCKICCEHCDIDLDSRTCLWCGLDLEMHIAEQAYERWKNRMKYGE